MKAVPQRIALAVLLLAPLATLHALEPDGDMAIRQQSHELCYQESVRNGCAGRPS
jgi:hypothetical protein